jgi:hypothetical protein
MTSSRPLETAADVERGIVDAAANNAQLDAKKRIEDRAAEYQKAMIGVEVGFGD